jgi:hypothetical protein
MTDGCEDAAAVDNIEDGAVGESVVSPPHPVSSSDSAPTTNPDSFMGALHCRFRSRANASVYPPGWQLMTS